MNDVRFALRQLTKRPGFTVAAVVTLGLGIGATTAVFSVVEAVLLRPLPYDAPERLALIWQRTASTGADRVRIPGPDVVEYRERTSTFEDFAFTSGAIDALIGEGDEGRHARIGIVTGNFFSVLGVRAHLGRLFAAGEAVVPREAFDDTTFTAPPSLLVIGHAFWSGRFGGDSAVIGRAVMVNGQPMRVIGILPPEFRLLAPPDAGLTTHVDAWTPLRIDLRYLRRDEGDWRDQDSDNTGMVIGRLRPGVSMEHARAEIDAVAAAQRQEVPFYALAGMRLEVAPMHTDAVAHAQPALLVLLGVVSAVLLIACLNVANLLMARAAARRREMALRSTLGATRGRLIRQALTESAVLALGGAFMGLLLARWGTDLLLVLAPADLLGGSDVGINRAILAFTVLISLGSVAVFGSAPALELASETRAEALRGHGSVASGRRGASTRRALVTVQVALSLVLLAASGLLVRSFVRLSAVDPGFDPAGVLTFNVTLPGGTIGGPGARAEFMRRAHDEIRGLPGVRAVGLIGGMPLAGDRWTQPYGLPPQSPEEWGEREANFRVITSDYFRAMGIRLLAGRAFTAEEDVVEDERVVIVDAALANRIAPGEPVVNQVIGFPLDGRPTWARIAGVVDNVRSETLRADGRPTIYVPYRQEASRTVAFAVRTEGRPLDLAEPIRRRLTALSGGTPIPVYDFRGLEQYVQADLAPTRFALAAVSGFAGVALALAIVGLYGLLAYSVSHRVREIGVRMAVGARPHDVFRTIVGDGLRLVLGGLFIGVVLATLGLRLLSGLLFDVPPTDPATYVTAAIVLVAVGTLACYLPARRAAQVDPMEALRYE